MPRFRTGVVTAVLAEREGLQRVEVDGRPAYVVTHLVGPVAPGDRVVLNTTAVDLGLGTGGADVVHWNLERAEWHGPGGGHVMKLRYTSLQADTGCAEEVPGYDEPADLAGMPVVACLLHSQVAAVAAAFRYAAPGARLVYVMTDGAALPLALSDLVAGLRGAGLLDATVTAGHAFGGDHEAVNMPSALRVALGVAGGDAAVVGPGPGGVGTATRYGFGALEAAAVIDAAERGGGRPILALRFSDADARQRHRGVSHHGLTVLEHAYGSALVAVPRGEPRPPTGDAEITETEVPDVAGLLRLAGLAVTTMGRSPVDDPRFFAYSGAAGVLAAMSLPAHGAIR